MQNETYLSDKQVGEHYGVSKSTVWRWVKKNTFPKPVKFSTGCTRWKLSDIEAWEVEQASAA